MVMKEGSGGGDEEEGRKVVRVVNMLHVAKMN